MNKQAAGRDCFVCGRKNDFGLKMEFYFDEDGVSVSHVVIPEQYQGYPGTVHGGIIAAILDEVSGRAFSEQGDHFMVTSEINIRYRHPVPVNAPLTVKGFRVRRHGRVAYGKAEIRDETGTLLAEANGVFVDIPEEKIKEMNPEQFGWKVYPDEN